MNNGQLVSSFIQTNKMPFTTIDIDTINKFCVNRMKATGKKLALKLKKATGTKIYWEKMPKDITLPLIISVSVFEMD